MNQFNFISTKNFYFGEDSFLKIKDIINTNSIRKIGIITGSHSFKASRHYHILLEILAETKVESRFYNVDGEPDVNTVDKITQDLQILSPDLILGIGGGSVIDTGKAVSMMLKNDGSILDYLECPGSKKPSGDKIPYIAVPTTAGTGSEATKNGVIKGGSHGDFKRSFRHDFFVPDYAIVDPLLTVSCPIDVTVASGLDAITQLIEAYVSKDPNPITDALAVSGLEAAYLGFVRSIEDGEDLEARSLMSYASYLSGVCIANSGVGLVHGIAGVLGGMYNIPHGVACGTMIAEITSRIMEELAKESSISHPAFVGLYKYAKAGYILNGMEMKANKSNLAEGCNLLVERLSAWIEEYDIKPLSAYGVRRPDIDEIAELSSSKNSPIDLSKEEIRSALMNRL